MNTRPETPANGQIEQPAGNYYDKYGTRNPLARMLMRGFLDAFEGLLDRCDGARSALEVGCGEAELTIRVARRGLEVSGIDIAPEIIAEAERRTAQAGISANLRSDSLFNLTAAHDRADLVVCCEVLEHVDDTQRALAKLRELCQYRLITSVPREPIWRGLNLARGKYIRDLGNTPGHVQHWSSRQFLDLLRGHFHVLEVRQPLPWTMALCEPRS
jgi:2-polyprenyl-3-methyl-5-hydroxy-6-metoxy-1,4-benzoquinol methylase